MKTCTACHQELPLSDFYRQGGKLMGACKACHRARVKANRLANLEYYQAYDRARGDRPDRVAARKAYQRTEAGQQAHIRAVSAYRERSQAATRAHGAVARAVRKGRLVPWPCEVCGRKAEAHHPHYGAPLLVTWLCTEHHRAVHSMSTVSNPHRKP